MNTRNFTKILAVAAALGAASPAFAASTGPDDETGLSTLGIDISRAGGSSESVQQFIAGLAPDTQRAVINGCQNAVNNPSTYGRAVVSFCLNTTGDNAAPMSSRVLGFAAEPLQPVEDPTALPKTPPANY